MGDMADYYNDINDLVDSDYEIQYNDQSHLTRRLPRWSFNAKHRKMKTMHPKNIDKFYVGAKHIAASIASSENNEWSHKTFEDAIAHAKSQMENEGLHCAIVVKIVAVLKRASPPIKVEKL